MTAYQLIVYFNNSLETRWLEYAYWTEKYFEKRHGGWRPWEWIDKF